MNIAVQFFRPVSVILLVFKVLTGIAQHGGFTPVHDFPAFQQKFLSSTQAITSIKSTFVQEKNLVMLKEKIQSKGSFWFKRENKVRLQYETPFHYTMIINGDLFIVRDDQKETVSNAHSNKLYRQINQIILDCIQGTILQNKDFTSKVFESPSQYLLEMTTVSKTLRDYFQTILLIVDKKDGSVVSMNLVEPGGDDTLIRFNERQLNGALDDQIFKR